MKWIRINDDLIQITKKIKDIEVRSITKNNKEIDESIGHKLIIHYMNDSTSTFEFKEKIDAIECLENIQEVLENKLNDGVFRVSG